MLRKISQIFTKGILTVLPIMITVALIFWLLDFFETIFGKLLRLVLPEQWYHFGIGLVFALIVIFIVGLLVQLWFGKQLLNFLEKLILRIPFVKNIYKPVKQAQDILTTSDKEKHGRPVIVKLTDGVEMIGIVMNETPFKQLNRQNNKVAVLLLWSYQVGGITIFVDKDAIEPLDMPVKQALTFAFTAGVGKTEEDSLKHYDKDN